MPYGGAYRIPVLILKCNRRRKDHWLSRGAAEKYSDYLGGATVLHAHPFIPSTAHPVQNSQRGAQYTVACAPRPVTDRLDVVRTPLPSTE